MLGLKILDSWLVAVTAASSGRMGKLHKCQSASAGTENPPSPVWYLETSEGVGQPKTVSRFRQVTQSEALDYIANPVNAEFTI